MHVVVSSSVRPWRWQVFLGVRPAAEDEVALTAAGIEQVVSVGTAPQPLVSGVPVYSVR